MSQIEITQLIAGAGVFIGLAGLLFALVLHRRVKTLQRSQKVIMGGKSKEDLVSHVVSLEEKVNNIREAMEDLTLSVRDHETQIDGCLSGVGMVRFNAYEDLGGQQSTTVAFLDAGEDGVVITTVVSREFARMYVKSIRNGRPDVALAPEESQAVEEARIHGNQPFTVRPRRREKIREEEEAKEAGWEDAGDYTETLEPAESLGWPKLEPPEQPNSEDESAAGEERNPQNEGQSRRQGYAPSKPSTK